MCGHQKAGPCSVHGQALGTFIGQVLQPHQSGGGPEKGKVALYRQRETLRKKKRQMLQGMWTSLSSPTQQYCLQAA